MRELTSGAVSIPVLASNLARFYFSQEFGYEIDTAIENAFPRGGLKMAAAVKEMSDAEIEQMRQGDFTILKKHGLSLADFTDRRRLNVLEALKIIWAMNKAARKAGGDTVTGYEKWLEENDAFYAEDAAADLYTEIRHGFFRDAAVCPAG